MISKKIFHAALSFTAILSAFAFISNKAFAQDDLATEKQLSSEYLQKMAQEPGATIIEQGIVTRPLFVSESAQYPVLTDTVQVAYYLTDREGKLIEESLTSDEVASFPLERLIACWKIAIPKMTVGSWSKISCPSDTAYGDKGAGDGLIKPGAALTFRVNLLGIEKK